MVKLIKNNKIKFIISCIITLLPMAVGLILWNKLPDTLATHFGADGNADGFASKALAVFLPSVVMLVLHIIALAITSADPKNKNQTPKAMGIVFWVVPVISLLSSGFIYSSALNVEFSFEHVLPLFLGITFILLGNYLPKCKQNHTIGIRVIWTLNDEENWNRTHRFGGKVWVISGIVALLSVFLPTKAISFVLVPALLCAAIIPIVYSYIFHRKQIKTGKTAHTSDTDNFRSGAQKISLVFVVVIMVFVGIISFVGDIKYTVDTASVAVDASFWPDAVIEYSDIDSIEYREHCKAGSRTGGFGSSKLLMGTFNNDEFGSYTRYSYTKCDAAIVIKADGKVLVLGDKSPEATKELYDSISSHTK